jgi:hypothetical protein
MEFFTHRHRDYVQFIKFVMKAKSEYEESIRMSGTGVYTLIGRYLIHTASKKRVDIEVYLDTDRVYHYTFMSRAYPCAISEKIDKRKGIIYVNQAYIDANMDTRAAIIYHELTHILGGHKTVLDVTQSIVYDIDGFYQWYWRMCAATCKTDKYLRQEHYADLVAASRTSPDLVIDLLSKPNIPKEMVDTRIYRDKRVRLLKSTPVNKVYFTNPPFEEIEIIKDCIDLRSINRQE